MRLGSALSGSPFIEGLEYADMRLTHAEAFAERLKVARPEPEMVQGNLPPSSLLFPGSGLAEQLARDVDSSAGP